MRIMLLCLLLLTGGLRHTAFAATPVTDRAAARLLDQATFGPTPSAIAQVEQQGMANWIAQQIAAKRSDLPDQPMKDSTGKNNRDMTPVQRAFLANAINGPDQLRQRVALALSEIWVVSELDVPDAYAFPPYWRIFRDNAFGNYRDIIKAVTLNPGMGRFLNTANNNKGNAALGTAANENYGRELLQLFTLGLNQLHPDGSAVLDANGNPVPTYTQADVTNMAKVLTGWTYPVAPGATGKSNNPAYYFGQMLASEKNHDSTEKTIFGGVTIPAGQTAEQDLESLLDALMAQPTLAPFVCAQLIQHLVTSNPSPGYVERVSSVFTNDGTGVAGNMKAVVTAILMDPEARAGDDPNAAPAPNFGHLREPVLFMANLVRGLNGTVGSASTLYIEATNMGQDLFEAPSVFSYFSPQYRTPAGLLGPEFQIYSTATAAVRVDAVNTALYGSFDKSTKMNLAPFEKYGSNLNALIGNIGYVFLYSGMSSDLQAQALSAAQAAGSTEDAVKAALYVTLTSGEYQIVH